MGGRETASGFRSPPWAELLFRHKVIAFITEHDVVDAILRHLERKEAQGARAPPN